MKKLLILAFALIVAGCNDKDCLTDYEITYIVENETDYEVSVTNSKSGEVFSIPAGTEEAISHNRMKGKCDNNEPLPDIYGPNDYIEPVGYSQDFKMTVNGKVMREIWLRKHWSFTSTKYTWTYKLNVTEELLDQLGFNRE